MKEKPARTPRLFVETGLRTGHVIELPEKVKHHVVRVLRLRPGDAVTVFDGTGGEWEAQLLPIGNIRLGAWRDVEREPPLRVTLVQGVSTAERMDSTVLNAGATAFRISARASCSRNTRTAIRFHGFFFLRTDQSVCAKPPQE